MAKLYALSRIVRQDKKDQEEEILRNTVFDAVAADAKSLCDMGAARPASKEEIENAGQLELIATQLDESVAMPIITDVAVPESGAAGDPNAAPKAAARSKS